MTNPIHIKDLVPDPANTRQHNPRNIGMVEDALQKVGFARSVVIDEDNVLLAGNGVIEACAQAGITRVQVVEADGETVVAVRRRNLTPEQKVLLSILDNRGSDLSSWNLEELAKKAAEVDLSLAWNQDELDALLMDYRPAPSLEDLSRSLGEGEWWPVIRLKVHPDVYRRYGGLMKEMEGGDDSERFASLLAMAESGRDAAAAPAD